MDLNDLRSLTTVLMFVAFIGIVVWAWAGKRRDSFDAAAQLPFIDSPGDGVAASARQGDKK
jgi:cytochrome c oxidase cbb3-type subunit 4